MSEASNGSGRTIEAIRAREVLDCRGLPTVQVDVELDGGVIGTADVPSGRSTGSNEACELRDGGDRFGGFGVRDAVDNVTGEIASMLVASVLPEQRALDVSLIELDGTADKSRLGANAILGVSLAAARARAQAAGIPLYRALNANAHVLPVPLVNLINGGKHASNDLDFQEFIVIPVGADSILEALQISTEVNLALAEILLERYGKSALNTGDEGGYAPGDLQPAGGARPAARGGRERRPRGPLPLRPRLRGDPLLRPRVRHLRARRRDARHRRDDRALPRADPGLRRDHDRGPARRGGLRRVRPADRGERDPDRRRRPLRHQPASVCAGGSPRTRPTRCCGR